MNITEQTTIGDLVAEDYRTATVFRDHGIDFCCNGKRSIAEACEKQDLEPGTLIKALIRSVQHVSEAATDFKSWPPDLLADYIEKKHHRYVTARIKEIQPLLNKVTIVHGTAHPELNEIGTLFDECALELTIHMKKEEMILFPYIRKMVASGTSPVDAPFQTIQSPIAMMMREHNAEGERFRRISTLSHNYTPPADACNTYRVTYALLEEFEQDLHMHIHLENNILFVRAAEMEQERRPE